MVDPTPFQWREPVQARGRKRVAAILEAARALTVEKGLAALKTSEVAARAGVPIGSLYQFFPTRSALLARLYAAEMASIDDALTRGLEGAKSVDDIVDGVEHMLTHTLSLVEARPWLEAVLSAPAVDPAIAEADLHNTRANAHRMAQRLLALAPGAPAKKLADTAIIICHLWAPMIRLRLSTDESADRVLATFADMIRGHLKTLTAS